MATISLNITIITLNMRQRFLASYRSSGEYNCFHWQR